MVDLLIRSILRWKTYTRAEALVQFPPTKSNELTEQQDMFATHHWLSNGLFDDKPSHEPMLSLLKENTQVIFQ